MLWKKKGVKSGSVSTAVMETGTDKKIAKDRVEKLSGPRQVPSPVEKYLIAEYKIDPDLVLILKTVVRESHEEDGAYDIRIYDESEAIAKKIVIKDYTSLDQHPDLILFDGWFNDRSKHVELAEKKKFICETTIYTQEEIQKRIESLDDPGSSTFFYMARGSNHGGPLGMGAAVVELNPSYSEKKGKKYNIYTADVIDMQPAGKGVKLYDANKPKDIACWVKDGHHKRIY